jgi:hypothetical protein
LFSILDLCFSEGYRNKCVSVWGLSPFSSMVVSQGPEGFGQCQGYCGDICCALLSIYFGNYRTGTSSFLLCLQWTGRTSNPIFVSLGVVLSVPLPCDL